jgi:hypothetical protein
LAPPFLGAFFLLKIKPCRDPATGLALSPRRAIFEDGKAPFGSRRPIAFAHNRNPNQKESVPMRNTATPFWKKYDRLKVGLSVASPHYPAGFKLATVASHTSAPAAN